MNTKCPQCDTSYNVTEAHIGRKVKCKNCSAALIVTENGLEFAAAAVPAVPSSPPVPPPAAAFAFDAGEDDRGPVDEEEPRKPAKSKGRRRNEEVDEADSDEDRPIRSRERKAKGPSNIGAYLSFRKMIVPVIIQIVFWVLVGAILLGAIVYAVISLFLGNGMLILIAFGSLIIGVPLYILLVRMYCELVMIVFRMYDTLTDIKQILEKQAGGDRPAASGP
ncbi:MAG: hypothetical protein JWO38_3901 [Gemmataceae bacterium]|nr:hypothetical protein [Gemmataceae bacterium]